MEIFDREFSLAQLVPESVLTSVARFAKQSGADGVAVFLADSSCFFSEGFDGPFDLERIGKALQTARKGEAQNTGMPGPGFLFFPIRYEGETVAHFVIRRAEGQEGAGGVMTAVKSLLEKMFPYIMEMNQKILMTSDLHAEVVEDTFEELRGKNIRLEKSEKKYRELAKSLEAEVQKKTKEIKYKQAQMMHQDKMASIGRLAAGVAHEINNPIGFIGSNLETLKNYLQSLNELTRQYRDLARRVSEKGETGKSTEIRDLIRDIKRLETEGEIDYVLNDIKDLFHESLQGIDRIKKIVITLRDFAHPGKESPELADINQNIDSTLNMIHNEIKYKAEVVKDYHDLPALYCYPRQLNQVFMNILINAVHAIETFGTISIATRHKDKNILVLISDTGVGIPQKNLRKIFDPFFTTKEVGKGTGLGLNLVYNIIRNHGGRIDVASTVGKGSQFLITLPLASGLEKQKERTDGAC